LFLNVLIVTLIMRYYKKTAALIGLVLLISCKEKKEEEAPCVCYLLYAPVCAGGKVFDNDCMARCEGYTDDEITSIKWEGQDPENLNCDSTD